MFDFPASPTNGQTVTNGSATYTWNASTMAWQQGASASVVTSFNTRQGAVTLQASDVSGVGGALLNAPVFTGDARAVTPLAGDNDTSIATTSFVQTALAGFA